MQSPGALRAIAARLQSLAGALAPALDPVRSHSGPEVWRGPAADRFSDELAGQRESLTGAAEEIRAIAANLLQQADVLEQDLLAEKLAAQKAAERNAFDKPLGPAFP